MIIMAYNNSVVKKPSDEARQSFIDAGLDYDALDDQKLRRLQQLVQEELSFHNEQHPDFIMTCTRMRFRHDRDGGIVSAALLADGPYFRGREGITFNGDGWIGFAGWACESNTKPFVNAFKRWVDTMEVVE